jgi:hypothetical protein
VLQACHRVATLSPGGAEAPTRERAGHP